METEAASRCAANTETMAGWALIDGAILVESMIYYRLGMDIWWNNLQWTVIKVGNCKGWEGRGNKKSSCSARITETMIGCNHMARTGIIMIVAVALAVHVE